MLFSVGHANLSVILPLKLVNMVYQIYQTCINFFTGKKIEKSFPIPHNVEAPNIE